MIILMNPRKINLTGVQKVTALPEHLLHVGMAAACEAARRGLGSTWPNPPVGAAALDDKGTVIGVNAHMYQGGAHAEAALLADFKARGLLESIHTLCVTLEPCNHHGRTPPCCDSIIAAGIKNIAVGVRDPHPHVLGCGVDRLRAAGITVTVGIMADTCSMLIAPFISMVLHGKPWLTIKRAFQRNGQMVPPSGEKTFTSANSLRIAHRLRKRARAILTGSGTILADDPQFTVRHVVDHVGIARDLVIIDRRRRVPEAWLKNCITRGLRPVVCNSLLDGLDYIKNQGISDVLVEAGPALSAATLAEGAWSLVIDLHQGNAGEEDKASLTFAPSTGLVVPENSVAEGITGFPEEWLPL